MDDLTEKHLTTTRGLQYRYYISPPTSSKYTLLLIHGFPDSARLYQFIIPSLLKTGLRIVAPDLIGSGGTSKPTDPAAYTWPLQSADLLDLLTAEGITSNIIPLGHDWGAALAQRFYMLHRHLCAGLITLAVALMAPAKQPFDLDALNAFTEQTLGYPIYAYWELFLPESGAHLMEANLERVWTVMHGDVDGWMKQLFCVRGAMKDFLEKPGDDWKSVPLKPLRDADRLKREWIAEKTEGGLVAPTCWYRAMAQNLQFESEKTMDGRVEVPYLFVACEGDVVCRADAIELTRGLVADCTVRSLKSGHWCTLERPGEVAEAVVGWLGEKGFVEK